MKKNKSVEKKLYFSFINHFVSIQLTVGSPTFFEETEAIGHWAEMHYNNQSSSPPFDGGANISAAGVGALAHQ